jgi:putative ABC transport system substrate-binding protein
MQFWRDRVKRIRPPHIDLTELYKRAASNIGSILRGTQLGDISFDQASKFGLSINLKAAQQLRISVPPALIASADKVLD